MEFILGGITIVVLYLGFTWVKFWQIRKGFLSSGTFIYKYLHNRLGMLSDENKTVDENMSHLIKVMELTSADSTADKRLYLTLVGHIYETYPDNMTDSELYSRLNDSFQAYLDNLRIKT